MIPVRLTVQNFMAYKTPQSVDFSDIHVACLTGENGAGKSSLLDAITWVLWGKARTRQDDDLIHLGESEMMVEFTFALGDETYRVLRRRTSARRGKSELHFHGYVPDAGDWRTLTEGSIRDTQAKINRLLRLDYDTFINSAFLLQGRADEFTTKKPAERKQILGDILGLGVYDEYEERAAEKVRYYQQEIRIVEAQIQQMEQEMGHEDAYRREWEESQNRALALSRDLRAADQRLNELRQQHKELDLKQRQLNDLQARLSRAQADLDELTQSVGQINSNIAVYRAAIARRAEIETGYRQLQQVRQENEDWNIRLAQSSTLAREQHRLETVIAQARAGVAADLKVKQAQHADLTAKANTSAVLQQQYNQLQQEIQSLTAIEDSRNAWRQELADLTAEAARLSAENKQLSAEMKTIRARLTQLEEAGSTCPVCAQPLNDTHRTAVHQQFQADGTQRGDKFRANQARLKKNQADQKRLQAEIQAADESLKRQPALHGQLARVEQQLQAAQQAAAAASALAAEVQTLQTQLDNAEFAGEEAVALAKISAELVAVGYDGEAHERAQAAVKSLLHFEEEWRQLQDAQSRLKDAQARLTQEQARRDRLLAQTATDRETADRLAQVTATLPQVTADLTAVNAQVDALQRKERLARDAVVAARQKLDHLAFLAKERGKKEDELTELRETQTIYRDLRAAFGKKGAQALLIEHAIPELEEEANAILSRMTDGRVNVQFVTQRTAKTTASTIETLDIRIADELGTRNYELYSGGEAFRVNFAIRIALSKLLARRAGASLQTLVMDEGFGTQDARGRERLVEAINTIQDEFEKIIVITHIEELQGAFPVHIFVQKTDQGSRITVE